MSEKVWSFSPGPACLPKEVMQTIQEEFFNWQGRGISILEVSHRSRAFLDFAAEARQDLRDILNISSDYEIIFCSGGVTAHFAYVPLNFLRAEQTASYTITGKWSVKAVREASRYARINVATDSREYDLLTIAPEQEWHVDPESKYLHYLSNETIDGLQFHHVPQVDIPLICDMSSDILSKPIDVSRYAMIYAGAQKNIGPAGLVICIIHRDWLKYDRQDVPIVFNYKEQAEADSMANTPVTFSWYVSGLVFKWIKKQGGLAAIAKINQQKAKSLYDYIDQSSLYSNSVDPAYRSQMNVIFDLKTPELTEDFVTKAEEVGLYGLRGHITRGGIRASIYNAMPLEGVEALLQFMKEYEKQV